MQLRVEDKKKKIEKFLFTNIWWFLLYPLLFVEHILAISLSTSWWTFNFGISVFHSTTSVHEWLCSGFFVCVVVVVVVVVVLILFQSYLIKEKLAEVVSAAWLNRTAFVLLVFFFLSWRITMKLLNHCVTVCRWDVLDQILDLVK